MVYDANGNSIVYAIGGRIDGGSDFSIQAYSVATNTWTRKTAGTNVYNTNGVGKIGSRLYFTGGWDYGSGTPLAFGQTWAYDYGHDLIDQESRHAEGHRRRRERCYQQQAACASRYLFGRSVPESALL
jgi:hypothetical protein